MRKMGSGLDIWEKMVLSAWISRVDHGKVKNASRVLTFILYGMSCQGTPFVWWYEIWYTYDMLRFENIFDIFSGCFHVPRYLMMCEQMLKELLNKKNWQYIKKILIKPTNTVLPVHAICHSIHHDVIHTVYKIITISGWNPIVFMASLANIC